MVLGHKPHTEPMKVKFAMTALQGLWCPKTKVDGYLPLTSTWDKESHRRTRQLKESICICKEANCM